MSAFNLKSYSTTKITQLSSSSGNIKSKHLSGRDHSHVGLPVRTLKQYTVAYSSKQDNAGGPEPKYLVALG